MKAVSAFGLRIRWRLAVAVVCALVLGTAGGARAAIAFVGKSSGQTANGGATSISLGKPAGVAAGQIEIATFSIAGSATITPPSGWTQILATVVGTSLIQTSFWHVAGSSEGTTTWSFSANSLAAGGIVVYSGVDTTTIVDAAADSSGTSGKTATVPSVTTTYAGDLVLGLGSFNNAGTLTAASGTTSRYTAKTGATTGPTLIAEDLTQASAGATTAQTITDASTSTAWVGQTITLKAASAAGVLSVSSSATPSFSANLDSGDQTPTYAVPLTTIASVSPAPGWNETITSTTFSTGTQSLSTSASTITSAPTVSCDTAYANCTSPTNSVSYPVSVPAGSTPPTAVKFVNAASGSGGGRFTITPTVSVSVPQNSFAGTYTSTLTIAIASGP
jgi:hypothetical protein